MSTSGGPTPPFTTLSVTHPANHITPSNALIRLLKTQSAVWSRVQGKSSLQAEEAQRKLKRQNGEDPALPPFCPLFASLGNILQCDVLLGMLGAVLQWAMEPSGGHWSESMLQRVLHLIGMALLEEQQQLENIGDDDEVTFNFTLKISRPGEAPGNTLSILALLETLQCAPHLEAHKDMIRWILKMVVSIKTMRERTAAAPPCEGTGHCHKASVSTWYSPSSCDSALVCMGPRRWRARGGERRQMEMCILCHEAQEILPDGTAMVLAAFVQRSTVMSEIRKRPPHNPESYDPLFMHPDLSFGTHTGSCGHIMHSHCWQRYFETLQSQDAQWLHEQTSCDVVNGEYLCPLCKCRSNTHSSPAPH
ncbi:E3 ubiquitin-protein ligase UBR2-like [Ictalurus punctatus]|uniref:E3 ubiquitin-protein ligase n=1 Tax=Ictalurus punctatus TaxID=7998 RepID=A0A9F7R6J8_ICTPU|nr:E3 ubiquitin-protein ligase UBR2-like [Ictalurus punctatus]